MALTRQQRTIARRIIERMAGKHPRQEIVQTVAERINVTYKSAVNIVSHSGLVANNQEVIKQHNRLKLEESRIDGAWRATSINIDTGRHPYIRVARIIDAKPGYSASFVNGVIHVNGKPLPPRIAFSIADQKWPLEA